MKAGSFFPGAHYSSLYAMAGDDCSLFFDLDDLTEKQQADHLSNIELTAMLQVALACIGHNKDHLALYEEYQEPGWQKMLQRYHDFFSRMTNAVIPMEHFSYHPKHTYYQSVAKYILANPALTDVVNLYMSSGSNKLIHQSDKLLEINRNVNSKKHFAENAPAFGIQIPDTLVTTKAELHSKSVRDFFSKHQNRIILKLLGLAGSRNVTAVDGIPATEAYIAEYADDMVVLLQERLALDEYTEMTVDLVVSTDDIRIANIRKILFADGLWVGNLIGNSVSLTDEQTKALLHVGEYARHHGYVTDEGSNCGIDFFIGKDGGLIVTEINARWTGGLFPAQILSQIDAKDVHAKNVHVKNVHVKNVHVKNKDAVPFFDRVLIEERQAYIDFIEHHLVGEYDGEFAMVPIGFGCFPVSIEGQDYFYSWQMVVGDFNAFKRAKNKALAPGVMVTADSIQPYQ